MNTLTDLLHILLCEHPHSYEPGDLSHRQEGLCYFYIETQLADCPLIDHDKWNNIARNMARDMGFRDNDEFLQFLKELLASTKHIRDLMASNEARRDFILHILSVG